MSSPYPTVLYPMPDLDTILELLLLLGVGAIVFLLRSLRSYITEKGKNFATKEDIGAITREVEKVRAEYAERFESLAQQNRLLLEHTRQRHELRLAALDRRLAAHQETYALWWKLLGSVHKEQEIGEVVTACQDWWVHNRLYLESLRGTFPEACFVTAYPNSKLELFQSDAS